MRNAINLEWFEKWNNSLTIHFELDTADSFLWVEEILIGRKCTTAIELEITFSFIISNKYEISSRLLGFENPLCSFTIEYFEYVVLSTLLNLTWNFS